jgi:hypothetical protein
MERVNPPWRGAMIRGWFRAGLPLGGWFWKSRRLESTHFSPRSLSEQPVRGSFAAGGEGRLGRFWSGMEDAPARLKAELKSCLYRADRPALARYVSGVVAGGSNFGGMVLEISEAGIDQSLTPISLRPACTWLECRRNLFWIRRQVGAVLVRDGGCSGEGES